MANVGQEQRELPGVREVSQVLTSRVRDRPWAAVGVAIGAGYLLGGGLFSRPTRWLARASLGLLALPSVRERVFGFAQQLRGRQTAEAPF
ncbi:MAG TPA: hypothetical protein VFK85_00150 [Anaeromyxobacteraceae bacterium]|nr:hypothetical protein [Anaeromyxobacteraceae bacterium]